MMLQPYLRARIDRLKVTGVAKRGDGVLLLCPRLAWAARLAEFEWVEVRNLKRRSRWLGPVVFGGPGDACITGSGKLTFRTGDSLRLSVFGWKATGCDCAATWVRVGRRNAPIEIREISARSVSLDPSFVPLPPRTERQEDFPEAVGEGAGL